ncbi:hypothetical protein LguiB_011752 [Lonicera macranthoides]
MCVDVDAAVWKIDELREDLRVNEEHLSRSKEEHAELVSNQLELQSQLERAQRDPALLEASIDLEKEKLLDVEKQLLNSFDIVESSRKAQEKNFS